MHARVAEDDATNLEKQGSSCHTCVEKAASVLVLYTQTKPADLVLAPSAGVYSAYRQVSAAAHTALVPTS